MKTIGLISGIGWESSHEYYKLINEEVHDRLGGLHSAKLVLVSLDLAEIVELQEAGEWDRVSEILVTGVKKLEAANVDMVLLCSNTVHKVVSIVQAATSVSVIDLVVTVAQEINNKGLHKIGLLGTKFTMEDGFYQDKLQSFGIETITPNEAQRTALHEIIFDTEFLGVKKMEAEQLVQDLIEDLIINGAEAIVLGCTELSFVTDSTVSKVPLLDTTKLHAEEAVRQALA